MSDAPLSRRFVIVLATLGSVLALASAYGFQYLGGLAPCHLCWLQRYPHFAAIGLGALALMIPAPLLTRLLALAGALAAFTTAALGAYHTGVERHWWLGPTTCTSGSIANISAKDLLAQIQAAPVVKCDQVAWQMFGLSMASWNMLFSLALMALWLMAAKKR
jgi:disulfide bond formation protein DsbB